VLFAPRLPDNVLTQTRNRFTRQLVSLPDNYWFSKPIVPRLFTQGAETERGASANDQTSWLIGKLGGVLRHKKERVFAWIHYYEPHESLRENSTAEHARDNYLSDVSLVDHEIGRLIEHLRKTDYFRDSLIIVFADHGEGLGERGYMGHHVYLNRFITDIPLMVHAPGVAAGHSNAMVEIGDIAPTILDWTNTASGATQARSLLQPPDPHAERFAFSVAFPVRGSALFELARSPIRDARALVNRIALVQQSAEDYQPKVSVTNERYRLIVNRITGARELYDRERDPAEADDLADTGLPVQARMLAALTDFTRKLSERIYCRVTTQAGP
jgi:arylsulfatase A-like enzyme